MLKKKILVADDDPGILDSLRLLLEEFDYEVETVANGRKLFAVKKPFPDVLLLDIWMSGVDGGEICKHLKNKRSTKQIPIIMISANKDTEQIAKASGADDFVAKPFELTELIGKIEKFTKTNSSLKN